MAGIGQEAVVPIRPDLATNLTPINFGVEQNAVAALSDAFRQGVITSDDIIQRYGTLAKTKEKAQIAELDEYLSPDAIARRQTAAKAADVDAQLKLDPLYQQAQQVKMQETINAAEAGSYPDMLKAAVGLGFFPKNRDAAWTDAKKAEVEQL